MNLSVQAKILRAIEQKEVRIVGGDNLIVDVRLIFASNKELQELVKENKFRKDLFFRLEGNIIKLPPLRERGEDVLILFEYFCNKFSGKHSCFTEIDNSLLKKEFQSYYWPGNVRELEKFTEYLFVIYDKIDNKIIIEELRNKKQGGKHSSQNVMNTITTTNNFTEATSAFEKEYLEYQLSLYDNKVSLTAKKIGLERTTLYKKMKKYGL